MFHSSIIFQSCDLWSLGVIIYVMLCGYPPFYSKHHSRTIPKDMRKKIMTGSFDFPEDEWSQISEMAKDIVRKWVFFPLLALLTFPLPYCPTHTFFIHSSSVKHVLPPLLVSSLQIAEGKTRGKTYHWGSLGSPLAQLHWGPGQCPAVCPDDDGQGEWQDLVCLNELRHISHCWKLVLITCSALVFSLSLQAVVAGIQQAHAEQLANMRIQDMNVSLKPLNSVNNPILRKRKLLGYDAFIYFIYFD